MRISTAAAMASHLILVISWRLWVCSMPALTIFFSSTFSRFLKQEAQTRTFWKEMSFFGSKMRLQSAQRPFSSCRRARLSAEAHCLHQ